MFYLMMVGYFSGLWWNQEMVFKREAVWQKMKEEVRAEPSFAVMYWNLNRRKESVDFGLDHVLKNNIDLAVFAEIHQTCYSDIKTFRQQMPGYQIESYLGRFLICSKLPFSLLGVGGFPGNSGYVQMRLDLGDRETELLAVDLMSNPFLNKKTQYEAYYKKLAEMDSPIVLGDFNTPLHSKYLEGMKNLGYHLAKLQSGRGLVATWPYGLPLITLDQVWIPKQEKSLLTEQGNQLSSDHDWLVVRLKK
jgi:endonuclease/exonuclease/phosphatase family metal-dependent hydrolase